MLNLLRTACIRKLEKINNTSSCFFLKKYPHQKYDIVGKVVIRSMSTFRAFPRNVIYIDKVLHR